MTTARAAPAPLVVPLSAAEARDAHRFGPKAANLAALARAGLPTPGGACVDAEAYRIQLRHLGLEAAARSAMDAERPLARRHALSVRLGLLERAIAAQIEAPLLAALREVAGEVPAVVRSSALVEDRPQSSFAGQFDSYLGLEGEADFLTAVRASWASLWSVRALRYMASHDVDPAEAAMAVLVQPLVDARASGGGLSHTADGGMLLTAAPGLGAAIAQGEVVPDRYVLGRDGAVRSVEGGRVGDQPSCDHGRDPTSTCLRPRQLLRSRRGLATAPLSAASAGQGSTSTSTSTSNSTSTSKFYPPPTTCLSPTQASDLRHLLLESERVLGTPVEIEWALGDEGFRLLQARPLRVEPRELPDELWLRHPAATGHPAGIGWGEGRACVVSCECELARVAPGDVLVTRVAGPALGDVLPRVAAVVAELGGSTSHLASLARERRIPMVLGVQGATQRIPEGAQVAVDGAAGLVRWVR